MTILQESRTKSLHILYTFVRVSTYAQLDFVQFGGKNRAWKLLEVR